MGQVAVGRLIFLGVSLVISIVAGYYLGDVLRLSDKPSEYIGVTFSILAATLFAVISIIGDPSMLLPGNWRVGWESAKGIQSDLHRFNLLFLWYILTLGLLVASEIIEFKGYSCLYFVHNIFAFFVCFGFLVSLALPFALAKIQRERLDQEIEQRKGRK